MKKEKENEEEQKPHFEIWLAAYNDRLVQIARAAAKAPVQGQSAESDSKPGPSSGTGA
jgi:dsDNA-binding SOS-regulon protein